MKNAGPCYKCKTDIYMPDGYYDACRASARISFWCPYGHEQHFTEGESEETKLRRERDRLKQETARLAEVADMANRSARQAHERAARAKAETKRIKKRVAVGVCPCCQRTVHSLAAHMRTKHPKFVAENVIQLKKASA